MTFGSPFAELAAAISALLTENETLRAQLAEQRQTVRGPHNFPRRAEQEDYIDYLLDMRIDDSKDPQLSRAATIVRQQITRIAELEAEVDRLMGVIANIPDALTHLQRLYTDPKSSSSLVAKATSLASAASKARRDRKFNSVRLRSPPPRPVPDHAVHGKRPHEWNRLPRCAQQPLC